MKKKVETIRKKEMDFTPSVWSFGGLLGTSVARRYVADTSRCVEASTRIAQVEERIQMASWDGEGEGRRRRKGQVIFSMFDEGTHTHTAQGLHL